MSSKRFFKEAAARADDYDDSRIFEALKSGVQKQFSSSAPPEMVEEMTQFFFREVKRRVTAKVGSGQATMDVFDEIDRPSIRVDGASKTFTPFSFYLQAERCGVHLTAANNLILQIRAALRENFSGEEFFNKWGEVTSACAVIFDKSLDDAPPILLRNNPQAIRLATSLAVDGTLSKNHPHPVDFNKDYESSLDLRVRANCKLVSIFLTNGVSLREIKSLQKYFECMGCLIHFVQALEGGHISPQLIHDLTSNISFLKSKKIEPQSATRFLQLFERHGRPFSFADYLRLIEMVGAIIDPSNMDMILSYTRDPASIEHIGMVLKKEEVTLSWLLAKYDEICGQPSFDQWVTMVERFGEQAFPLAARVRDRAGPFLDSCRVIGDEYARAITRLIVPATVDEYVCLHVFQTEYPQISWEVRVRYAASKSSLESVKIRLQTNERYKIPHDWLLATSDKNENPEALALTWLFEKDLNRKPTSAEFFMLASEEFIHEARRRGLKKSLRKHDHWIDHIHANHRVEEEAEAPPESVPLAIEREKAVNSAPAPAGEEIFQLTWPEPEDPCERRLWVGWRVIKTLWRKRKIGRVGSHLEDVRRDVPRSLGRELDEAVEALRRDGIFLITDRSFRQISLNPDRMDLIKEILARRLPTVGFFADWVNAPRKILDRA